MKSVKINLGDRSYPIYISDDFKGLKEAAIKGQLSGKALLVTDSNVDRFFSEELMGILKVSGLDVKKYVFPAGEASKNLSVVDKIYEACLEHNLDRKSTIFAVGGGVTGDMAGFAAATYLRGINFVQIPTSSLAQADSSVGGKVGVDFQNAKNMVGAFYQPKFVYMNVSTLKALPRREFISGLAEVIKHGIIYDKEFFGFLCANIVKVLSADTKTMIKLAERNCIIKGSVVEQDEKESGIRAILNFGHTIGHAIETAMNFELLHGECVSIGIAGAAKIAQRMELLSSKEKDIIIGVLKKFNLPVDIKGKGLDYRTVYDLMFLDKKREGSRLKFILPIRIGEVVQRSDVPKDAVIEVLRELV